MKTDFLWQGILRKCARDMAELIHAIKHGDIIRAQEIAVTKDIDIKYQNKNQLALH